MLISLQNISFHFGSRVIVEDAQWQIDRGERIGLVGANGAGKSTLLRLMTGGYPPDGGTVQKPRDVSIGFFNQDLLSFSSAESILSVGMLAYEKARELEAEMADLLQKMEGDPENPELLDRYSHALADFEAAGGYEMEHKTAEVLEGLGFTTADLQRPYNEFSGGWRMRVLLARMILQRPDLLLLDEPTNHLDLPSIEWLEKYLQGYPGSVVIVSHDRYFLDRMVTKIVEIWDQRLHFYSGNYKVYEKEKAERREIQQRAYENQQDYIRTQERFVERFKAKASKATQAQSVIKKLEKLERIAPAETQQQRMNIHFDPGITPGKIIARFKGVSKRYGSLQILDQAEAEINRGDKIALIGANGKGKSTLLRIIAGIEPIDEGELIPGHNVRASFYAQHQLESLDLDAEILEELGQSGSGKTEMELRQLLGCFLFSGDDVFKKIRVLSGGEKARVALAKTVAMKSNFLLLDEPTNHLDMVSVDRLVEALNQYQGTFIGVSHDRYFIQRTANRIWEIVDGKVRDFRGTYDEWREWSLSREGLEPRSELPEAKRPDPAPRTRNTETEVSREVVKERQRLQRQFEKLEKEIESLKARIRETESRLAEEGVYADPEIFQPLEKAYGALKKELEEKDSEFNAVFEKIMETDLTNEE